MPANVRTRWPNAARQHRSCHRKKHKRQIPHQGQTMRPVRQRSRQARTAQTIAAPWPARPRACPAPPRQTRGEHRGGRGHCGAERAGHPKRSRPLPHARRKPVVVSGHARHTERASCIDPATATPRPPLCKCEPAQHSDGPLGPATLCLERLRLQLVVSARSCSVRAKHPLPREMRLGPDFAHRSA